MKKITAAVNKMIDDITIVPKIYQIFSIFPPYKIKTIHQQNTRIFVFRI
jgi:hypothetical protein